MSRNSENTQQHYRDVDTEREKCRRQKGKCWICHEPINCDLHYLDRMAFTLDHIPAMAVPLKRGEVRRKKWAHRKCNSERGDGTNAKTLHTTRKW